MSNLAVSAIAMTAITPAWTGSETTRSTTSGTLPAMFSEMTRSPCGADFLDRSRNLAAHDRPGEHEQSHARQADDRADRAGERFLADERNRVDRDPLAADVVPIGLRDRAERHLADLRPAAHDDDALAVNLRERRRRFDARHAGNRPQLRRERIDRAVERELEVDLRFAILRAVDIRRR